MEGYIEHSEKIIIQHIDNHGMVNEKATSNDHLFDEKSLEQLRELNQSFGVVHAKKKYKTQYGKLHISYKLQIIMLMVDEKTGETESCFMYLSAFIDLFANRFVLERKKGKMVRVPIAKAWLKWTGKRVFSLDG